MDRDPAASHGTTARAGIMQCARCVLMQYGRRVPGRQREREARVRRRTPNRAQRLACPGAVPELLDLSLDLQSAGVTS